MPEELFELRRGLSNRKSSYKESTVATIYKEIARTGKLPNKINQGY